MNARATTLPGILRAAAQEAEDRVQGDFSKMVSGLPDDVRLRDELERVIDDVPDPDVQKELRRVLGAIDDHRERLRWAFDLSVSSALDLVRTVATDVECGFV
jgi:hypothetical protein